MAMKTMLMFLCIAIATSTALRLETLRANGTLYCSTNGSPAGNGNITPVFPGATMTISCTGNILGFTPPLNATTDSNGYYTVIDFPRRENGTVAAIVSNCRLIVHTPLSTCNPTLPSASLVSNLQFVKTVDAFFSVTIYMVASGFTLQPN